MSFSTYNFNYSSPFSETPDAFPAQTSCNKAITISEDSGWAVPMREFANFLGSVYGYNITEQILIEQWDGSHVSLSDFGV